MGSRDVAIQLTSDEALVLFEFASRFTNNDSLTVEHPAERAAIWCLTAAREKLLVEPLRPDYLELLAAAQERLVEQAGVADWPRE